MRTAHWHDADCLPLWHPGLATHELGVHVGRRRRRRDAVEVGEDRAEGSRHAVRLVHSARLPALPAEADADAVL